MSNILHFMLQTGPLDDLPTISPLFLELVSEEMTETRPSPRAIATHMLPGLIPRATFKNNRKVIMIRRNPKDVVVSLFYHLQKDRMMGDGLNISWNCFVENWMKGISTFMTYNVPFTSSFLLYVLVIHCWLAYNINSYFRIRCLGGNMHLLTRDLVAIYS